jgi:trans-aconitate methyltransferase
MPQQRSPKTWDADQYTRTASFVVEMGEPVLELLSPRLGERILDVGCGDGKLTQRLVDVGAIVVGVDASSAMVEAARKRGIDAHLMSADALEFQAEFDAVFSNAALHWVLQPAKALAGIYRALKPGGRLIAEFGGYGNIHDICVALQTVLARRGVDFHAVSPWYFPSPDEYSALLRGAGFTVDSIGLIDRPTRINGDVSEWLALFASSMLEALPAGERRPAVDEMHKMLEPKMVGADGVWTAGYVRLRLAAHRA